MKTVNKLRTARLAASLTQQQLAERVGVIQQQIARWEKGEFKPQADALKALSQALGCKIEDLI